MIEVNIERVVSDKISDAFVVLLREKNGQRLLPVWIRRLEAESIAAAVQHVKPKRPLTHDLCKAIIGAMGGKLQAVHITMMKGDTYYAELLIAQPDGVLHVDSRPSDAMAIAVRMAAPILVEESLLAYVDVQTIDEVGNIVDSGIAGSIIADSGASAATTPELSSDQLKAYLEKLRPEDFGKFSP